MNKRSKNDISREVNSRVRISHGHPLIFIFTWIYHVTYNKKIKLKQDFEDHLQISVNMLNKISKEFNSNIWRYTGI